MVNFVYAPISLTVSVLYWVVMERYARHASPTSRAVSDKSTKVNLTGVAFALFFPFISFTPLLSTSYIDSLSSFAAALLFTVELSAFPLRFWAMKTLGNFFSRSLIVQPNQRVIQTGPYAHIRHPGYLANFLLFLPHALLVSQNWIVFAVVAVVLGAIWHARITLEEQMLLRELKDEYANYAKRTHRLIPFVY